MADEVVGGAIVKIGIDGSELAAQGARAAAQVGAAMDKAEKAQGRVTKQIQANIDRLNATKAVAAMQLLDQAVTQMGGRAKLNADQIARLTNEINRLSAAGAKIPKSLQLPSVGRGSAGIQAAASTALSGAGPGGALGAGLAALGPGGLAAGAVVAGIAAITTEFIRESDALDELSKKTSLSIATLDAWGMAAKTSGVTAEQLAESALKLSANIAQGDSVFARLGLNLDQLRAADTAEQMRIVGQRILELKTPGEQAAAAIEAFGKSGTDALQAFRDGFFEALPAAEQGARAIEDSRKAAAELADQIDELGKSWQSIKVGIGSVAVPALVFLLNVVKDTAEEFRGLGGLFQGGPARFLGDASFFDVKGGASTTGGKKPEPPGGARFQSQAEIAAAQAAGAKIKAQQEKDARERIAIAKQVTTETRQLEELLANESIAFHRRVTEERQKEMEKQVSIAESAEQRILADFLLANNIKIEQINALGEKVQIVTQAEIDAARRRAGRALGGSGQLVSDISDEGLPTRFFSRFKDVNDELKKTQGHLFAVKDGTGKAAVSTRDWNQELANAAHLMAAMPGLLGKVGSALVSVQAGVSSIAATFKNMGGLGGIGKSLTGGGATSLLGKAGNILGGLGAVGSIASAAFGVGKAIVGLFQSDPVKKAQQQAGKAFGHEVSREMAEQLLNESKQTGKSVTELATKMRQDQEREAAISKRRALEEGLSTFQAGFEQAQEALKDIEKSPALQAALAQIGASLDDALGKAGLFRTPEALKQSQAFGAAQTAAGGLAQAAAGARQAGVIDTALQAALGVASKELQAQAVAAAKAAGLGDAEAQKAGFGAVAGLLREQLNSQLQANGKVDAALQAQLDEAKANGIEILADPAIESLNVQKQQLEVLEKGFGVVADKVDAAGQMQAAAAGKVGGPGGSIIDFPGARALPGPAAFVGQDLMAQVQASAGALGGESVGVLEDIRSLLANAGPTTVVSDITTNIQMDPFAINETRTEALRAATEAVKTLVRNRDADFLAAFDGR